MHNIDCITVATECPNANEEDTNYYKGREHSIDVIEILMSEKLPPQTYLVPTVEWFDEGAKLKMGDLRISVNITMQICTDSFFLGFYIILTDLTIW